MRDASGAVAKAAGLAVAANRAAQNYDFR